MDDVLARALVWLARREESERDAYGTRDADCREAVQQTRRLMPINDRTLEALLERTPDHGDLTPYGTWLFLPAPRKGELRIPVLNCVYDYRVTPARISMQWAGFFMRDGKLYATAWRFETPESSGEDELSSHGYFHAQPSHSLRRAVGDVGLPIPTNRTVQGHPTIPVDAEDEVELLVCVLMSIYGLRETIDLIRTAGEPQLDERLRMLRSVQVLGT